MDNVKRYDTPPMRNKKIEAMSKANAILMSKTDPVRAKYFNNLRKSSDFQLGGRRTNKNKKKHKKLSRRRRHHSKKNRKSMKRK